MVFSTQSSSKARLKNDTIGDEGLKSLYDAYGRMSVDEFRRYCIQLVQSGGGKQPLKDEFVKQLNELNSKDRMLQKANNFAFAGMGLGV